jgi:hypothetical protein
MEESKQRLEDGSKSFRTVPKPGEVVVVVVEGFGQSAGSIPSSLVIFDLQSSCSACRG